MLVRFDVDQSLQDRSWGDGRDVAARQWRRAVVWGLFRRFTHSGVWCRLGQGVGVAWPVRRRMSTMTTFVARNIRDDLSGSAPEPGYRVLVDRLWPRGVRKADAALDETAKELTPSTELRQAFHHGELDFDTFAARYRAELDDSDEPSAFVDRVKDEDVVVLLYGAADREHNHALVLRDYLAELSD